MKRRLPLHLGAWARKGRGQSGDAGTSQLRPSHVPAQRVGATGPMVDNRPTRAEVLAEVHGLVEAVRAENGPVPGVGSPEWSTAPPTARVAGLLVLAEAWLLADPDRIAREQLKAAAADLAGARSWADAAHLPSHAELQRRRSVVP